MPIDPYLRSRLSLLDGIRDLEHALSDHDRSRRYRAWNVDPSDWVKPQSVSANDISVGGPHGPVGLRVYRSSDSHQEPCAALLWVHGGGFVMGDLDMNEAHMVSAELAARSSAVVVSVNYRLATEGVKYPVPLDDVCAAWDWMVTNAEALGADPQALFIGGASAGGNLATAASMRMRDAGPTTARGMLLAYPAVHFPVPPLSSEMVDEMRALPSILRFPVEYHEHNLLNYLGRVSDIPAGAVPGNHRLQGLPPALVAVAEYDDLRPSGELFVRQLRESGVPVHEHLAAGLFHGFFNRAPSLPGVETALQVFADALSMAP